MELLHTYSDGSKLYKIPVRALIQIPIWKGNRIIDQRHVVNIQQSIKGNIMSLDSGYKTIQYTEYDGNNAPIKTSYIIDGQHRISVVIDHFEMEPDAPDFFVTVTQLRVESEADVIDYFNKINNVKPIQFEEDKNIIVNKYIQALCMKYNTEWTVIRPGATKRPYLSVDKLRGALVRRYHELKGISARVFVTRCEEANHHIISRWYSSPIEKTVLKGIQLKFGLALDEKLKWLDGVLRSEQTDTEDTCPVRDRVQRQAAANTE